MCGKVLEGYIMLKKSRIKNCDGKINHFEKEYNKFFCQFAVHLHIFINNLEDFKREI